MARDLMPKSGIMMPHIVVTRDAAVVGVSTVDGKAGSIDLTVTYRKIDDSYSKTEIYTKAEIDNLITPIMTGVLFKADPFVDNNVPFRSGGANGITSIDLIKAASDNSIHIGDSSSGVQGMHLFSEGRIDVTYKNDAGADTVAPLYSKRHRPEIVDMPFASIGTYVLDSKGRTVGVTKTGINSDLKTLTALTNINATSVIFEKSPVVPDPVNPYEVATKRYVDNQSGGSGPTMNGIMNYGVGSFRLHDSRAYIAPYEVASDGQILDRALWPELWAHAQVHGAIDDSVWVADPSKRGLYSNGDGSTTFRTPDRNGAQKNGVNGFTGPSSIIALFGRGDSGAVGAGDVRLSAAPDVSGQFQTAIPAGATGAFKQGALNATKLTTGGTTDTGIVTFKLSDGNSIYGRSTGEISPNAFIAVWVIRASGGFTAANTSWSVINGDAVVPSSGIVVRGGEVISNYRVGSADYVSAVFRAKVTISGEATPEVVLRDNRSGTNVETIFPVRNGISADVGYTLLSVSNPALGSRTVLTNPFGNNTPVMCEVEVFHAALGKWMTTPWTWVQTNNNTYGCNAWFAEGEGIILKIGNTGYVSATSFTGASQEISTPLIVSSSVRIRVWKLVP
jgi:hypothetical protein